MKNALKFDKILRFQGIPGSTKIAADPKAVPAQTSCHCFCRPALRGFFRFNHPVNNDIEKNNVINRLLVVSTGNRYHVYLGRSTLFLLVWMLYFPTMIDFLYWEKYN
jgi:hypothetical protein